MRKMRAGEECGPPRSRRTSPHEQGQREVPEPRPRRRRRSRPPVILGRDGQQPGQEHHHEVGAKRQTVTRMIAGMASVSRSASEASEPSGPRKLVEQPFAGGRGTATRAHARIGMMLVRNIALHAGAPPGPRVLMASASPSPTSVMKIVELADVTRVWRAPRGRSDRG